MGRRQIYPLAVSITVLLFCLLLLVALAQARAAVVAESPARPNIIFVVVDAVRADHLSSYGYERQTTPNLDNFFADGARFDDASVSSAWTFPSNAALLSGRRPHRFDLQWSDDRAALPATELLLAEYLHDAGYYTAGFYNNYYVGEKFGFAQGFDLYQPALAPVQGEPTAADLNQQLFAWLNERWLPDLQGQQPLFLFLYYYDPHSWYNPPEPYDLLYDAHYTGTITPELFGHAEKVVSGELALTERDVEHVIALYDGEIAYWDHHFGEMVARLQDLDLLDDSIVVVTSDHGQLFGEHGHWLHRNALYEEVLRVPLLIRYPPLVTAGTTVTTPVQTMDITPTLLEWLALPPPPAADAVSLTPLLAGTPVTSTRTIYAELDPVTSRHNPVYPLAAHHPWYALRREGWKVIHHAGAPWLDELYRLNSASVYEGENLWASEPQQAARLRAELLDTFGVPTDYGYLPLLR